MVYNPFTCCWIQSANILLEIFASLFIGDSGLQDLNNATILAKYLFKFRDSKYYFFNGLSMNL